MKARRCLKITLPWHSLRSDNLGVGALTLSHIEILKAASARVGIGLDLTVLGYGGPKDYSIASPGTKECIVSDKRTWLPGGSAFNAITRSDLVIDIGAGDSWADIYGFKRFLWQLLSKEMALIARVPLVLAPQTIGPYSSGLIQMLARRTMQRSLRTFARDAESFSLLEELGIKQSGMTVDVAFRLPFVRRAKSGGRIRFGFNVSGLLYAGGYTGKNQLGSSEVYRDMVGKIITGLSARNDIEVILVPHVIPDNGSKEDDIAISRTLAQHYPGLSLAPNFSSPVDAKSFISGLDVFAGSRMHATIAAVSSGTAVIPLAYSRKFRGVFSSIGYPLVGDCTSMSAQELAQLTLNAVDERVALAARAEHGTESAKRALMTYEDFLCQQMIKLDGRA
jgi:colanic acid/amylovoran biosynthesis protein